MPHLRFTAAALLLAGCSAMPAEPPASEPGRCLHWRWTLEPRLLATVGLTGGIQPSGQLIARPACARREPPR